ncbi:MAG: asparaginase domain-containing protein, partial [Clostridia bacterium]
INFEFKTPFEIHSENLNNSHLNVLYNLFKTINYSDYIGIIITHGSDTLPYTSAFLSLICQDTPIPIIITASNRPISHPKSNAIVNLKSSLWFILNANTNGIFVIYKDDEINVYKADMLREADIATDKFSDTSPIFGKISNNSFKVFSEMPIKKQLHKISINNNFENSIAVISPYPNLDYDNFSFKSNVKAILHTTYHSSTISTKGNTTSVLNFIKKCEENNIDFYILSEKDKKDFLYDSRLEIFKTSAIILSCMGKETALMKLIIAYNQRNIPPKVFMQN